MSRPSARYRDYHLWEPIMFHDGRWLWWDRSDREWKPETTEAHRARREFRVADAAAERLAIRHARLLVEGR